MNKEKGAPSNSNASIESLAATNALNFIPAIGLKNPHLNTILSNRGPRKWLTQVRAKALNAASKELILTCADKVKLQGFITKNPANKGLICFIHGWEGNVNSSYLLSAATHLYNLGYSIFRLHLRDHGDTHHLNVQPFLATRLDEAAHAIAQAQALFPADKNYLVGYSLGGNFTARVASVAQHWGITLNRAIGICPVIDPYNSAEVINQSALYNRYFINKWKASLVKKQHLFPELNITQEELSGGKLMEMQTDLIVRFSGYPTDKDYFAGYGLNPKNIQQMPVPCHLIFAEDDPVILASGIHKIPKFDNISIEIQTYGGHCGFIQDYKLRAWTDLRIAQLIEQSQ